MLLFAALALGEPFVSEPNIQVDENRDSRVITSQPYVAWERRLPETLLGARSQSQLSEPTLEDGLLYVGSAFSHALHALESRTGSEIRSFPAHSSVQSEPIFENEYVIFCDKGGYTFNYSATDAVPNWEHFGGAPITSQPKLIGGNVVVTSVDDSIYSLLSSTGEVAWRYDHPPSLNRETELTLYGAPSAVAWSDQIITGFSDGSIVALSATTGAVEWQNEVGEGTYPDIIATPIVVDDNIYTGGFEGPFVALMPQTNSIRWSLDIGTANEPTYDNQSIFHGGADGILRKIDTITGQIIWEWDANIEGSLTTPRITDAGILTSSSEETIYLIDGSTGDEIWRFADDVTLSGFSSSISIGDSGFYAVTNKGKLISFETLQEQSLNETQSF